MKYLSLFTIFNILPKYSPIPKNKICIPENKTIDAINVGYPIGIFGLFNFSNIIKIKAIRLIIEITKPKIKKIY